MVYSVKNIILGLCATGLAIGSAFASYSAGPKYKVKKGDGTFLAAKGIGCSGSGTIKCMAKVKTFDGSKVAFENATVFDEHGSTIGGEVIY
jgi:hypothetical protein